MQRQNNPNLMILELAVNALGALVDDMVFIGGCATGLLITDLAAPAIRATKDVDVITEVASLKAYHRLSEQLRGLGFKEDQSEQAPICRWLGHGVILDVMPTNEKVLGFGNQWYQPALENAVQIALPSARSIRLVTAPYFLMTKFAAFEGRGSGDYLLSHDIEDIVALLDGRSAIVEDVRNADEVVKNAIKEQFSVMIKNERFLEAIPGHLPGDAASQARLPLIMERIDALAKLV
jgi:predicted nucleotidyltransferase